ncbi:transaldolase [Cryobacterium sp. HLT2-28]|uniref:transaldolase n=1 Tax=Cryobacterium sp. HLT2-28 TaxID=1259146 RepID=UPI00106C0276|nr:transaldolase [Cryobacterium sp. HLT2-28]TFB94972.1 transaldolase [Cryobacterium sp. HLT2-28]
MNATRDTPSSSPTDALSKEGVSIWLDDLSRERILSGGLRMLIAERHVVGITTNPSIFAAALSTGDAYDAQISHLAAAGTTLAEAVCELTTDDVAAACDILRPILDSTDGIDGWVSIEVSPNVAHDAAGTVDEAKKLRTKIDRPNVYIKIPATVEGLEAITTATALGISVNVTLIFSLVRYREVIFAYLSGLESARAAGIDLRSIHSVASFFVSRVDTEFDKLLTAIGTDAAQTVKGKSGIANARLAYQIFQHEFETDRARELLADGAHVQRPLWASTGVKDPSLPDTTYVVDLVAPGIVNTMPEKTLAAVFDHGNIRGNSIAGTYRSAQAVMDAITALGISYDDATATLEREGVDKFIASWRQLSDTVDAALRAAR